MEETAIVVMLKEKNTGFLDKELVTYKIPEFGNLILNIFAQQEDQEVYVYLKLTTDREVHDWEFDAMYDYYDEQIFGEDVLGVTEEEECYNPTWQVKLVYDENIGLMEEKIQNVLVLHKNELDDVYEAIQDKKLEYENKIK